MDKELEEAKKILNNYIEKYYERNKYCLAFNEDSLKQAIETILQALENSIHKEVIEKKIKELLNTKGDFATHIAISERIKVLLELLEGE